MLGREGGSSTGEVGARNYKCCFSCDICPKPRCSASPGTTKRSVGADENHTRFMVCCLVL